MNIQKPDSFPPSEYWSSLVIRSSILFTKFGHGKSLTQTITVSGLFLTFLFLEIFGLHSDKLNIEWLGKHKPEQKLTTIGAHQLWEYKW